MNEIATICHSFKQSMTPHTQNPQHPVKFWTEKDVLQNSIVNAYVIILRTQGCHWAQKSGCTMCGYFNDSMMTPVSETDLQKQIKTALKKYTNEPIIKIFTSGSFLDNQEMPPKTRNQILQQLSTTTKKIIFESRPEFITEKKLKEIKQIIPDTQIEIGIGLETTNDNIRQKIINKGFPYQHFLEAAETIQNNKFLLKTYVLLKPPFLTEQESISDCITTIQTIAKHSDTMSLNPTNVQRHTLVEFLWKRKQYRPPWLWSVIEVLKQSKKQTKKRIQCDIAGGGTPRGAHNCPNCNHTVLKTIADFSLNQQTNKFNNLTCTCIEQWRDQLDLENLTFGSHVDFSEELI